MIERDLRDIANVHDVGSMLRLLSVFAARTATLFNQSDVSRITGIPNTTLSRYIAMFEALFLVHFLPAWSPNLEKRLVKSPKLHIVDSGLAAHLCGMNEERLTNDPMRAGGLLESFVAMELLKQAGWTDHPASLWHYRSHAGEEIDVILEDRAGFVAGVEVKLAATVSKNDMRSLAGLRDALGDRFVRGVVLYGGDEIVPMGDRITALPMGAVFAPA